MAKRNTSRGGDDDRVPTSAPKKRAKKVPGKSAARKPLVLIFAWGVTLALWALVLGGAALAYFAWDLPSIDDALAQTRKPSLVVLDRDGRQIARFGDIRGESIPVQSMPFYLVQAVISTEDRRFYEHFGIDVWGIARAAMANLRAGRIVQGGSTITQQAAKNLFLTPDRTLKRKIQEVMLALWLEEKFTKNQILTLYLNRVYFGSGTFGVAAAAETFFGRSVAELNLRQAAVIAGLLKAPSRLSPLVNPTGASLRADEVMDNMVEAGFLSPEALAEERNRPLEFRAGSNTKRIARYFLDWIVEQLDGFVGPDPGDLVIHTTLDVGIQRFAEAELERTLERGGPQSDVGQGAIVVMAPDGAVRAMVGGRDYGESQFNRAVQARRQPGSAFKPIIYQAGLEAGVGPEQMFVDRPLDIGGWKPSNFDDKFRGPIRVREALADSINTVAVQIAEKAGQQRILSVARRLGITTPVPPDLSAALGSGEATLIELTAAYAVFANGGDGVWAYGIVAIDDANGKRLYERQGGGPGRVLETSDVAMMNTMLAGVIDHGTGKAARIDRPAAGKTGTSSDFRDAWFVGFTRDLVTGVWLGNDDGHAMKRMTGSGLPARIWQRVMAEAHEGLPARALIGTAWPAPVAEAPEPPRPVAPEKSFWDRIKDAIGVR